MVRTGQKQDNQTAGEEGGGNPKIPGGREEVEYVEE